MSAADLPMGVVRGMSFRDYLAVDALSNSGLKLLARSPLHFHASKDPARPDAEPSDALRRGTLAHCAVLEPHELGRRYRVKPEGMNFATKDGKAWRDATPEGMEIVSDAEFKAAARQAANVRALPEVAAILGGGEPEVSFFWMDQRTGAHCKARADWVHRTSRGVVLLDLKTTDDASPQAFGRSVARYGYHTQAAWYSDGWTHATGETVLGFVFAAVESSWPHAAAPYLIDDAGMEKAREQIAQLLDLHADCTAAGRWPGIADEIQTLSLPAWA